MPRADTVIAGGEIVDGTGAAPRRADIAVEGDTIIAVEPDLGALDAGERIDASGCHVTPGIIDIHSHADWTLSVDGRAESAVLQGITTIVPGQCGHGVAPVGDPALLRICAIGLDRDTEAEVPWRRFGEWTDALRATRPAVNIVPLVAHGPVRLAVMGPSVDPASDDDIQAMRGHVEEAMEAGAAGLSTGLEYQPGQSTGQAELTMLAEVAGAHDGIYATHSRNRTSRIEQAAVEAIDIATRSGCRLQLSHFLPRPYAEQDAFARALDRMEALRADGMSAYCDVHPHLIGPGPLAQMLPGWAWAAGPAELPALMQDPAWRARVLADLDPRMREYLNSGIADGMLISHAPGSDSALGRTLGEIARERGITADAAAMELMRDAGEDFYTVTELEQWTTREDMDRFLAHEQFMLMGDGLTLSSSGKLSRFHFCLADWNWVPEVLYEQVLKRGVTPIESAVRRMTSMPAKQLGLTKRGVLEAGYRADITVFEPAVTAHPWDADDPLRILYPRGSFVRLLLVNGIKTVEAGALTGQAGGTVGRA